MARDREVDENSSDIIQWHASTITGYFAFAHIRIMIAGWKKVVKTGK